MKLNDKSFLFLDPPYEGFAKSMYNAKTDFDFDEFAERCSAASSKCQFMITINDSETNRERFRKFNIYARGVYYGMSKKTKPEIVICNYELPNQDFQIGLLGYEQICGNGSSFVSPNNDIVRFPGEGNLVDKVGIISNNADFGKKSSQVIRTRESSKTVPLNIDMDNIPDAIRLHPDFQGDIK